MPGVQDIALALRRDLRALGNDQAGAGALSIIVDIQRVGRIIAMGRTVARQRRHDDTVFQRDVADL